MSIQSFRRFFRPSLSLGIGYQLVNYLSILTCGYGLSSLLESAMAQRWQSMYPTAVGILMLLMLSGGALYLLSTRKSRFQLQDTQRFRTFLYQNILEGTLPIANAGEMNTRMTDDVKTISIFFQETLSKGICGLVVIVLSTFLLCRIHLWIGLIFFLLNLTQLLPIFLYEGWARKIYNRTHSDEESYCSWMLEGYNGVRTIKAYGLESWYMEHYWKRNRAIVKSGKRAEQAGTLENIVFRAIDSLLNYGSYVMIGLFILAGKVHFLQSPILIILAGQLFSSISSVFNLWLQYIDAQEACARLKCQKEQSPPSTREGVVQVSHISKAYGEKRVLQDVSLTVHPGDRMLLTGAYGSGKSTLLRILSGLERADSGSVRIGLPRDFWAGAFQEEPKLHIPGAELLAAMEEAGFIDSDRFREHLAGFGLEENLCKPLSELSAGERKKFFLSAALAHQGKLLILDEPTNHLDKDSIAYLTQALLSYRQTLIVCTHADMDLKWSRVICVSGGKCHAQ